MEYLLLEFKDPHSGYRTVRDLYPLLGNVVSFSQFLCRHGPFPSPLIGLISGNFLEKVIPPLS